MKVHTARLWVYTGCAMLCALTVIAAMLPKGWLLLTTLLVVGAGALGLFPCYYSFTQELSSAHIGKLSGLLAAAGWVVSSPLQKLFGWVVDVTKSYDVGLAVVGLAPLLGLLAMLLLWRRDAEREKG